LRAGQQSPAGPELPLHLRQRAGALRRIGADRAEPLAPPGQPEGRPVGPRSRRPASARFPWPGAQRPEDEVMARIEPGVEQAQAVPPDQRRAPLGQLGQHGARQEHAVARHERHGERRLVDDLLEAPGIGMRVIARQTFLDAPDPRLHRLLELSVDQPAHLVLDQQERQHRGQQQHQGDAHVHAQELPSHGRAPAIRYPTPRTVLMNSGDAGSSSSFCRKRETYTSMLRSRPS